ncbi:TlpA disulfide reductase family protein [Gordonia sp. DT218]|uniref:TlpA disulfide reductase family protein n=1 Tax=Gordonia sp. DT218 TaxID=3416659 RepID=UPI003CEB040A
MNQTPTDADSGAAESEPGPPEPSRPPGGRFPASARWTLVFIVVMIALVVAIWPRGGGDDTAGGSDPATATGPKATDAQVDEGQLAQARRDAALEPCPQTGLPVGPASVLAGVTAPCLADGKPYDVGVGTAGKPMVVNMWAVWCLPCRRELPEMADYAQRAGDKVTVLAVHAQEGAQNPYLALRFLAENNVHLPVVLDPDARIAGALKAPRVFPSTILVRADGTVAKVLPQVFDDPDQIAAAVHQYLGVTT